MRQFIADTELDKSGCLYVSGEKFHYLNNVLRLQNGQMINVRLPSGILQPMTLCKSDGKQIVLQAAGEIVQKSSENHARPLENHSGPELWLFQFVAKPPKMDLIIRQATECGVSRIIPVCGEFCQSGSIESAKKKSDSSKDNRWQKIIEEARQQSGSPVNTSVEKMLNLKQAADLWKSVSDRKNLGVVLYEQTEGSLTIRDAVFQSAEVEVVSIVVGSEGGISPQEVQFLSENGFIPVHFKTNILRCETAALYGIAALQSSLEFNQQ